MRSHPSHPLKLQGLKFTDIEGGFPHSEILGSKLVRSSPRLIAAYHVLHRLLAPRHPPDTLIALDCSHYRCPPSTHILGRGGGGCLSCEKPDTISKDQYSLRTYPGTERSSLFTAGMHDRVQIFQKARMLLSDPGSSGYVSSSRCLGTRQKCACWPKAMQSANFQRNFVMDGALFVQRSTGRLGGAGRDRTDDLKLAKLPLSQLSYGPIFESLKHQSQLHRPEGSQARLRAAHVCASARRPEAKDGGPGRT